MTKIIAEIGVNHDEDFLTAIDMTRDLIKAGCKLIKYQLWSKNHFPEIENLRLTEEQIKYLLEYCSIYEAEGFATAFDRSAIEYLYKNGQTCWKIPSGFISNDDYIAEICKMNPSVVYMSSGMAYLSDIEKQYQKIKNSCNAFIIPFHCVSIYPSPLHYINLNAIRTIKDCFGLAGFSDHSGDIDVAKAAIALGADVIEIHVTYSKERKGPDHRASLNIQEIKDLVTYNHKIDLAKGNGIKSPSPDELVNKPAILKRMVL